MKRKMTFVVVAVITVVAALAVLLVLLLVMNRGISGATPSEATANSELEQRAESMDALAEELLQVVGDAGLKPLTAHGRIEESGGMEGVRYCLRYRVGIKVATNTTDAADFSALDKQLLATGWEHSDAVMSKDPEHPGARFLRDGVELDVTTGGFTSGGTRYGADEIAMTVKRNDDDCVYVPDFDRVRAAQERFGKEIYPGS